MTRATGGAGEIGDTGAPRETNTSDETEAMDETTATDAAQRLSKVSGELLRMRDEGPIRLRVWEFESVTDRLEDDDDPTPTFGVDEPDAEARAEGLVHIAAKLHVDGVHGWAYISLDLAEDEATVDRESYLDPDHCVRSRVPFALDDGYRLRGRALGDAEGFAAWVVRVLRDELEDLRALQAGGGGPD